ncbi:hypothetical protein [Streptomyces sp. NPDC026673]|uniref:hypothetical protein n=1 Tax=Streptomyces sp. NPDC026673 TaxID=3155724 RepID=UPI0033E99127
MTAALTLTTACGGGGEGDTAGRRTTSAEAEKRLSQQDLDRLALNTHEVPGYTAKAVTGKGAPVDHDMLATYRAVTPATCRPVYAAADLGSLHDFSAKVEGDVVSDSDGLAHHASVGLTSYTRPDALKVMAELRAALPLCTTASMLPSASHPGAGLGYSGTRGRSAGDYGDDSIAFDTTQVIAEAGGGPTIPLTVLVVRKGSTVAAFASLNPTQPPVIPENIIEAQLKKLG